MIFQRIKVTWINRENASSNLPKIKDLRGGWINGKFDVRMAGGCNLFGYDNFVWDKLKLENKFMFSTAQNSDSVYKQLASKLEFRSLTDVYYSGTSGSDSIECAIRAAYTLTDKRKIVTRQGTWHGSTIVSSLCGNHEFFDGQDLINTEENIIKPIEYFDDYKLLDELVKSDIEFLKTQKDVGIFLIEPLPCNSTGLSYVFNDSGVYNDLRKYCDENEIILIFDEIQLGFKTGKKYFTEHLDIDPDFLCISKCVTSGVIPFSVVISKESYLKKLKHGHTWSGHYLGAVAANHTIDYFYDCLENLNLLVKEFGSHFDNVLGSLWSISQNKGKQSERILNVSWGAAHNKMLYMIPPNTPKKHLEFIIKETLCDS